MKDKITASFLLGACGDTLGAPIEGIFSLQKIIDKYGVDGLRDIISYDNPFDDHQHIEAGRVTDDTTMMMTVAAALVMARREASPKDDNFTDIMRRYLWQGFLNWGQHQDDAQAISSKIDQTIAWPDSVKPFWFHCGAGSGTIAALLQNEPSRVGHIIDYNCTIRGKEVKSPNQGCGGMMRVAPIAFLPDLPLAETFRLAAESAAPTNAHPDAYVAAGITALYIRFAAEGMGIQSAIDKALIVTDGYASHPSYRDGITQCRTAIEAAQDAARDQTFDFATINSLPDKIGYKNPFLAIPVLAQVTYACLACKDDPSRIKDTLVLAANHRGDSDSVAAIVGHILGARHGTVAIPADYLSALQHRNDIMRMASEFHEAFHKPPAPAAGIKKPGM